MAFTSRPRKKIAVLPSASSALPIAMRIPPLITARGDQRRDPHRDRQRAARARQHGGLLPRPAGERHGGRAAQAQRQRDRRLPVSGGGARRDAGFSIFYMGINTGAFIGSLI